MNLLTLSMDHHHALSIFTQKLFFNKKGPHNIICRSENLSIPHPSHYHREVSDLKNAKTKYFQKEISNFAWSRTFHNQNSNRKFKNVFPNFVPHKVKNFDYRTPE